MDEDLEELWWKSSQTAEEDEEIKDEMSLVEELNTNASRPVCFTEKLLTQKNFNV